MSENNSGERLQKVIAQAGIASRRHAEQMIVDGRVQVNDKKITSLGTKVQPEDKIVVDGQMLKQKKEKKVYYLLYKPTGYITSITDPRGRRTVLDLMKDIKERVYPVGRLDYDTSGLLVLTNDGELAHRLMHPSFGVEKTYRVSVKGSVPSEAINQLRKGVILEDGKTAPAKVRLMNRQSQGSLQKLEITIHEGKNRQVRRMFDKIGFPVVTLERIRFGPLTLDKDLENGNYRALTREEIQLLKVSVKLR